MKPYIWLHKSTVKAIHNEQLAEHGGMAGVRDEALLESALARPLNLASYGKPSVATLAASYAYGIARNHPFIDGNKRTAFVASATFMLLNGYDLTADDADAVIIFLKLAAGDLTEAALAEWLHENGSTIY